MGAEETFICVACQHFDHYYCQEAPCTCPCWDRGGWRKTVLMRGGKRARVPDLAGPTRVSPERASVLHYPEPGR